MKIGNLQCGYELTVWIGSSFDNAVQEHDNEMIALAKFAVYFAVDFFTTESKIITD